MALQDVHALVPKTCEYVVALNGKRYFSDVIKLRLLRWEDYPGLSLWTHCNQRNFVYWETGDSETERKQGGDRSRVQTVGAAGRNNAMSQAMWMTSRSWKRQRNRFFSKASGENMAELTH